MDAGPFGDDDIPAIVAFAQAEHARQFRAQMITQLELGVTGLAELFELDRDDHRLGSVKAVVLLQALPGVGKVAARKALGHLGLDEGTRVAQLDASARQGLIDALSRPTSA